MKVCFFKQSDCFAMIRKKMPVTSYPFQVTGNRQHCNNDVNSLKSLFHQLQFLNNIGSAAQFINTPQYITDINTNGAVQIFIKSQLMTQRFIVAIESKAQSIHHCHL